MTDARRIAIEQWIQAQDEDILYAADAIRVDPDMGPMLTVMIARAQTLTEAEAVTLLGFDPRKTCDASP